MITRPLTPYEEEWYRKQGIDPTGFTIEESIPDPATSSTSSVSAGGRSLLASAIPTAAGGAGFAGGMKAGLALPIPHPIGKAAAGLIGGAIGAYMASRAGSAAQQAIIPESWKQQLQQDVQEHPVATTVGSLATLPLGGMNPSRLGTLGALGGLGRKAIGLPISATEKAAMANAAIGATFGGVQEAVLEKTHGEDLSPGNIALNAAIGATFTQPNRIGRAYGFKPLPARTIDDAKRFSGLQVPKATGQVVEETTSETQSRPAYQEIPMLQAIKMGLAAQGTRLPEEGKQFPRLSRNAQKSAEIIAAGGKVVSRESPDILEIIKKQKYYSNKNIAPVTEPKPTPEPQPAPTEKPDWVKNIEAIPQKNRNEGQQERLDKFYKGGARSHEAEEGLTPAIRYKDKIYTGSWHGKAAMDLSEDLFARNTPLDRSKVEKGVVNKEGIFEPREQKPETTVLSPLGSEVLNKYPREAQIEITPEYYEELAKLAAQHGIEVAPDGMLKSKGLAGVTKGKIFNFINPKIASPDTQPHEIWHGIRFILEEEAANGNKRAIELLKKLDSASEKGFKEYNQLRELSGKEPVKDIHEFTAMEQGYEFVKRQFNLNDETKWQQWWNDTKALFNAKYNEKASIEDLRRAINFRLVNEPTLGFSAKNLLSKENVVPINRERSQPEDEGIPPMREGERLVLVRNKDTGKVYPAAFAGKYYEWVGGQKIASIGRINEQGWSHGMLKPDEEIIEGGRQVKSDENKMQGKDEGLPREGEGRTPYPFTLKEFNKGTDIQEALTSYHIDKATSGEDLGDTRLTAESEAFLSPERNQLQNEGLFTTKTEKLLKSGQPSYQGADEGLTDISKKGFFRPLEATFDKVSRVSTQLSEAFNRWETKRDEFIGLRNVALSDLTKFNQSDINIVHNRMRNAYRTDEELKLTGKYKDIYDILSGYYSKIADIRKESGLLIEQRKPGKDVNYVPDLLSDKTIDLFVNKSQSPEATTALNNWVKHVVKESEGAVSEKEARENITHYIRALGGEKFNYLAANFGAIRKAAGYGLPEGLRETDGVRALTRYSQRAATDLAMYIELESKPEIANSLLLKNPNTSKFHPGVDRNTPIPQATEIRDAMKWVTGSWSGTIGQSAPKVSALIRLVNNSLLGTATGIRNVAQMPVNAIPYIHQFSDLGAMWNGLLKTRQNSRNALITAARQPQIDKLQFNEVLYAPDRFTSIVRKLATTMRKVQGAEAIENISRDITFSIGKELARNNILGAKAGNVKSKQWLERFGILVDKDITKLSGAELESALNQVGKNFTDVNQGTYGGRGLPAGIMESQFAPFFSLQKWSVEKSNVIYKDVVKPFMDGSNRLPLITYTLGTVLTGAAIQQLNELLTNRKGQDPTWQEALDKGDTKAIVSELSTLMQLASFGGIVGDSLKFLTDTTLHGKTPRNIVSFPTATAILNLEEKTKDMLEAINQGENPWDVFKMYALDMITAQVQGARLIANHTVKEKDVERSDKYRDVRIYNELQGKPASEISKANPYLGLSSKKFKRSGDLGEAIRMLSPLLRQKFEKSGGDYEKLSSSMRSLKGNSYQTMPSLENTPVSFQNYYNFLIRTQGKDAADARLQDYIRQTTINKVKSSLVPSF